MKKLLSVIIFCLVLAVLVVVVYIQNTNKERRLSELARSCTTKRSSDFASERVHGVILSDRTIATVRLEEEKNFSPPGGHIEINENSKQALIRELKEELSISTEASAFKNYKIYCEVLGATKAQRTYVYFVENWKGKIEVNNKDQFKWVNSEYRLNSDADTELVSLLGYLKNDNLID